MMDAELKQTITRCVERVLREVESGKLKVTPQGRGRFSHSLSAPRALLFSAQTVRQRLVYRRLWGTAVEAIAEDWLPAFVASVHRKMNADQAKAERSAARERQMEMFPGFEALPTRIRRGRNYLNLTDATVTQFLEYADRYQQRSQKSYETAAELRRMVEKVKPYMEIDPDLPLPVAFERARFEEPKLAIVSNGGTK